jgi:hypothetical protein
MAGLLAKVTRVVQTPSKAFGCFTLEAFTFAIAFTFARFAFAFSFPLALAFVTFCKKKRAPTFGRRSFSFGRVQFVAPLCGVRVRNVLVLAVLCGARRETAG